MVGRVKLIVGSRCVGGMNSWADEDDFDGDVKTS